MTLRVAARGGGGRPHDERSWARLPAEAERILFLSNGSSSPPPAVDSIKRYAGCHSRAPLQPTPLLCVCSLSFVRLAPVQGSSRAENPQRALLRNLIRFPIRWANAKGMCAIDFDGALLHPLGQINFACCSNLGHSRAWFANDVKDSSPRVKF